MTNLFEAFPSVNKEEWIASILKASKKEDTTFLHTKDEIEEFDYSALYHKENALNSSSPGNIPFTRGSKTADNHWNNGAFLEFNDEKKVNQQALQALNTGANLLVFKSNKKTSNWNVVLNDIAIKHVYLQFNVNELHELESILNLVAEYPKNIQFNIDFFELYNKKETFITLLKTIHNQKIPCININGFLVQQGGANIQQEISFCLNAGHEALLQILDAGYSLQEAVQMLNFNLGVGGDYFLEISKFRAFRQLWYKIVAAYGVIEEMPYNITCYIGHCNKVLQDPYTNILRQSTETMAAISGGIKNIVVLPYDLYSSNGPSEFSRRMALNISLILAEESYFDKVIDPQGGSYTVEQLTRIISQACWQKFQQTEKNGGLLIQENLSAFVNKVNEKRNQRIKRLNNAEIKVIGLNCYKNDSNKDLTWKIPKDYLGITPFIMESANISIAKK